MCSRTRAGPIALLLYRARSKVGLLDRTPVANKDIRAEVRSRRPHEAAKFRVHRDLREEGVVGTNSGEDRTAEQRREIQPPALAIRKRDLDAPLT